MAKLIKTIAAVILGSALTHGALAQEAAGAGNAASPTMLEAGAFNSLSAQNQKIAELIFDRQIVTAQGAAPLSLDQIAVALIRGGWSELFRRMKSDGLTKARSLRQFVGETYGKQSFSGQPDQQRPPRTTIVTMASGGQIIFDKKSGSASLGDKGPGRTFKARYTHSYQSSNGQMIYRGRLHSAAITGY